jgi:hypothetical protein
MASGTTMSAAHWRPAGYRPEEAVVVTKAVGKGPEMVELEMP